LGLLKQCGCDAGLIGGGYPCWVCDGDGRRMPTEEEVRTAIFETGVDFVEVGTSSSGFAGLCFGGDERWRVLVDNGEVETGTSVLLALLRALEVVGG
jgi:hypothetical protein